MKTRLLLTVLALACIIGGASAQNDNAQDISPADTKNLVKVNLFALPLNNFSFQYERAIGKKTAVGLGFRYMPNSGVPLKNSLEQVIDDPETWDQIHSFKTGNVAITPEIRFYAGKGVFRGFYFAPFARISRFSAELPFEYEFEAENPDGSTFTRTENILLKGNVNTITAGILLGAQWKVSRLVYLDWWILGPQYGGSKGHIIGSKNLLPEEQNELRAELSDLDIPLVDATTSVNSSGARMDFKGPWAGLRAGLNLGIRF
ncbi:MAG TPA: DUF3575 domain-containing protein [Sphingobacteriaceae bacterium]